MMFDCSSLVVYFEVREGDTASFVLFFQDFFGNSGSLWFHIHFTIICSGFVKNIICILLGLALNQLIVFSSMDILGVSILPF